MNVAAVQGTFSPPSVGNGHVSISVGHCAAQSQRLSRSDDILSTGSHLPCRRDWRRAWNYGMKLSSYFHVHKTIIEVSDYSMRVRKREYLRMTLSCAVSLTLSAEFIAVHVSVELSATIAGDMVRFPSPGPRV